jgi:hypothetical protein
MPRKMYFFVGAIAIAVVALAAVHHGLTPTPAAPASLAAPGSGLPTFMLIHGHINYKDIEHCFVQDSANTKRALYLDALTDVKDIDPGKVDLKLYNLKNGEIIMTKGKEWDVSVNGYMINIVIKADKPRPPHLGPGPYTAAITVDSGARNASSYRTWSYPYGTWVDGTSPIPDCWY